MHYFWTAGPNVHLLRVCCRYHKCMLYNTDCNQKTYDSIHFLWLWTPQPFHFSFFFSSSHLHFDASNKRCARVSLSDVRREIHTSQQHPLHQVQPLLWKEEAHSNLKRRFLAEMKTNPIIKNSSFLVPFLQFNIWRFWNQVGGCSLFIFPHLSQLYF